jgi:tRNA pseudouridine55 synthase
MVDMIRLKELAADGGLGALDSLLLPVDAALEHWAAVTLSDDAAYYLRLGQAVLVPNAPTAGWVRIYSKDHRFIGVGCIQDDGRVAPKRLLEDNRAAV